jgi:recombination protein RecA
MPKKKQSSSSDKKKAENVSDVEELIESLQTRYGEGAIMKLGERRKVNVDSIPSGSFSLDIALGVGGLPRGRVIEIYGPESGGKTTLSLHAIAEAQKRGGKAAFIDAEHALDPEYAKRIGVKFKDLIISQPDSGDEALNILEDVVKSGAIDIVVVDSVAALTPKEELEGEMGDKHIGLQARLMSQALRKITAVAGRTGTIIIFINQIRMKIGVMYGCFSYDSEVLLADGSRGRIGKIVNNKMPVDVLSYNFEKGKIESQPVTDWHVNGKTEEFLQFFVQNHTGNGRRGFSCTPDHKIYTSKGWKKAKNIKVGDEIMVKINNEPLNPSQEQIILGSLLGDGNIRKQCEQTAYFREEHGPKQVGYIKWLANALGDLISNVNLKTNRGNALLESRTLLSLGDLSNLFYPKGQKLVPQEIVSKVGPQALAVWYCGDGSLGTGMCYWKGKSYKRRPRATLYTNGFKDKKSRDNITKVFEKFGIKPSWHKVENTKRITLSASESDKFFKLIAPYMPPAMAYKLPLKYRKLYEDRSDNSRENKEIIRGMKVKKIKKRIPYKNGQRISKNRFDISVANNHNYFVDGCLVSNSPETTPGGRALKFYSSVRLDIRRKAQIKRGDEVVGNRTNVKVVKNKVAAPFRIAEFDIFYGKGISYESDLLNSAVKYGVVKRKGSSYQYNGKSIAVGFDKARRKLQEDKKFLKEIEKETKKEIEREAKESEDN